MSTILSPPEIKTPPLCAGDRLSRDEFERRYFAMTEVNKAELVEGVVYMPSPVCTEEHGSPHFSMIGWLSIYQFATPGTQGGDNATCRLDLDNEPSTRRIPPHPSRIRRAVANRERIR